jgi:hypothetical protein
MLNNAKHVGYKYFTEFSIVYAHCSLAVILLASVGGTLYLPLTSCS